ncbi:MAG: NAD(P)-dependent oxidoreductase [Verrucomicrobia bacterium]|nr:NAD(P)-dependent oxidoreductase [Verrucomicrobiota bacterium]
MKHSNQRRILLTGATGFVGRQILKALLEEDCLIQCIVRPGQEVDLPKSPKIRPPIFTEDLFQESVCWWKNVFQGIDTIVHVAWYAEPGKYQLSMKNLDCLAGTLHLAQAAAEVSVRRFVGVGTCFEYQHSSATLSVESPLGPTSPYAAAKVSTYLTLSNCLPMHGVEFAWCRLFYLYGVGEDSRRLVPSIRNALSHGQEVALTSGTQVRDFLDVQEAGKRIAKVVMGSHAGPVNICSGEPVTVRELAESIADVYGRRDLLKFGARAENPVDPAFVVGIPSIL